ncbi:hypothetical protein BKA65DRAFT_584858 [Rhexocercosporidium sp. MPI-PUGE-AT-0058]|nr:hypothetical protein BKA65DRAFT_584858 [Rhexocercosporidium sp. MPI-PUGE-AT-0058]
MGSVLRDEMRKAYSGMLTLGSDPDAAGTLDKFRLLEFLDQFLSKASPEERARIDETLLKKISDLAAFNEQLALVRSHRPRAVQLDVTDENSPDEGLAWRFMSKTMFNIELGRDKQQIATKRSLQEIPLPWASLGPLLETFMSQQPSKTISDGKWASKETGQRNALQKFWDSFRNVHQNRLKTAGVHHLDILGDMKFIKAENSTGYLEEEEAWAQDLSATARAKPLASSLSNETSSRRRNARGKTFQDSQSQGIVEPVKSPMPSKPIRSKDGKFDMNTERQTEWGSTPSDLKLTDSSKTKTKTRGEPSMEEALADLNISRTDQLQPRPERVLVKKSAFDVLRTFFPTRGSSTSVAWDKFVDAMAKVGFMSRRSGGSAVTLSPVVDPNGTASAVSFSTTLILTRRSIR